jgi:hypothetical protein
MAITLNGTTGITFPVAAGSASTLQASSGRVLQVVPTSFAGTTQSTTSTTFVATAFSASITPSSASSKIYIVFMGENLNTSGAQYGMFTLYKNSTNLGGSDGMVQNNSTSAWIPFTLSWVDSPATTSSTTYTIYQKTSSVTNSISVGWGANAQNHMTLMEIAA